jgi:hypothetical protein
MVARDYLAEAEALDAAQQERVRKDRIANLAAQMQQADEREAQLTAHRKFHGLPDHATPRQMADAEIDHGHKLRDYIVSRAGAASWIKKLDAKGNAVLDERGNPMLERVPMHPAELLSPATVEDPVRQEKIADIRAVLVRQFNEKVYPAEVAAKVRASEAVTDSAKTHYSHNLTVAA